MDARIYNIIRKQLGARFEIMTGARDFVGTDVNLTFKIGRNAKSISHVQIVLNASDLYDITFLRVRAGRSTIVATANDVYWENLAREVGAATGMAVSL